PPIGALPSYKSRRAAIHPQHCSSTKRRFPNHADNNFASSLTAGSSCFPLEHTAPLATWKRFPAPSYKSMITGTKIDLYNFHSGNMETN
ncbi:hypothetical protein ACTXI4_18220, partial [Glutamicibacter ardleyensis]|uniref:hypothetical protein n=1 Tax=Glutamicibacter ardleyensis TaxID=225894 RepID=UPI003FD01AEC